MKEIDLTGVLILTFLLGGIFTGLGGVMKTQNAGDMLNGFDYNKYDKEKTSKIVGSIFLYTGFSIFILGLSSLFLDNTFYKYISPIQVGLVIISVILAYFRLETKCRKR